MKTKLLILAAAAMAFSLAGSAYANDVALSPKAQGIQNSLRKVGEVTPDVLDHSYNLLKYGSPKGVTLAESLRKAPGANSATVAWVGYRATDSLGTAASPKHRQQLDELNQPFEVAPLK